MNFLTKGYTNVSADVAKCIHPDCLKQFAFHTAKLSAQNTLHEESVLLNAQKALKQVFIQDN